MTSPLRLPKGSVIAEQSVITERYGEVTIFVPEWLQGHSEELLANQKCAINLGAVSMEGVTHLKHNFHLGWAFDNVLACYYFNTPPIEREQLHLTYPNLVPFSWIESLSPVPRVLGGLFGVQKEVCFQPWFKQITVSKLELKVVMDRHTDYFKSLSLVPITYRLLRSNTNEHTRIYCLREERLEDFFQDSMFNLSDAEKPGYSCHARTFALIDTEEPGWFYGTRKFELSDTEMLVSFCRVRLESVSKEVVDKIAFCWLQTLALRSSEEQMELMRGRDLSRASKRDNITLALKLLLRLKSSATEGEARGIEDVKEAITPKFGDPKVVASWIKEIKEATANRFSGSPGKHKRVVEDVLPSLFYVAQHHEHRQAQPGSNPEMIIEWQYIARRGDGQRE